MGGSPTTGDGKAALVEDSSMEQEEVSDFAKPNPDKDVSFDQYSNDYWGRRRYYYSNPSSWSRQRKEARPKMTENSEVSLEEEEHQAASPTTGDGKAALVEDSSMEQDEVSDFAKPNPD